MLLPTPPRTAQGQGQGQPACRTTGGLPWPAALADRLVGAAWSSGWEGPLSSVTRVWMHCDTWQWRVGGRPWVSFDQADVSEA